MKKNFLTFVIFLIFFSYHFIAAQGIIKDDFIVNDDTSNTHQFNSSISMDANGNFVIAWQDYRYIINGDIYFQRYNSAGLALGINSKANDDFNDADQEHPSISMTVTGDFVIAWDDDRNANYDIYFQRYSAAGTTLGANIKVNDNSDSTKQYDPSTAIDEVGDFVIVWQDEREGNSDIYFQRYTSTGLALGINTKVNDDAANADQINPSIAMDALGNFVIVWHDFRNSDWDIYCQIFTNTGTSLGTNIKVNDDAVSNFQLNPSITMDAAGNFVIAWQDYRNSDWDIYFQRYTDTGIALGVNTKVNDDVGYAYQKVPSISINEVGDFVIVWQDYRYGQTNSDIFGQRYFSNGYANGGNYRIVAEGPNNGEASPAICSNNSSIIFSWEDNRLSNGWDIFAKIVDWNWNGVATLTEKENDKPEKFILYQNYPNPFNPATKITWQSPVNGWQTLKIFDILGREVATLVNEYRKAGKYEVEFNLSAGKESPETSILLPASGIYFYQLKAGSFIQTKKMLLLK